MSEPIKPGDLVMIVRHNHTCAEVLLGKIFTVLALRSHEAGQDCNRCGAVGFNAGAMTAQYTGLPGSLNNSGYVPVAWLKKIDPPKLDQDERHDEEITA